MESSTHNIEYSIYIPNVSNNNNNQLLEDFFNVISEFDQTFTSEHF